MASSPAPGHAAGTAQPVSMALPVALQAEPYTGKAGLAPPSVGMECPLGTPEICFTVPASPASGKYLNVGSFFDRRQRSLDSHYFLKLVENTSGSALDVTGVGMHITSTNGGSRIVPAVGVLKTSRSAPTLPAPTDLLELQAAGIVGEALGVETCVEFPAIRLSAEESAWLVVRFPVADANSFFGLLVDDDATDEGCDFMTPDDGQMYYRPDPRNGPAFDWAITAYTQSVTSKAPVEDIAWSNFKVYYRNVGPASTK